MPKLSLSLLEKNPTLYAVNLHEINGIDADFVARLQYETTLAASQQTSSAVETRPALALLQRFITLIAPDKPQTTWLELPPVVQELINTLTAQCEETNALDTRFSHMALNRPTAPLFDEEKILILTAVEPLSPTREPEVWDESELDQENEIYHNPFNNAEESHDSELPTLKLERSPSNHSTTRPVLFLPRPTAPVSAPIPESFIEHKNTISDEIAALEPRNKRTRHNDKSTATSIVPLKRLKDATKLQQQLKQLQRDLVLEQDRQRKQIDIYRSLALHTNKTRFYRSPNPLTAHKNRLTDIQSNITRLRHEINKIQTELSQEELISQRFQHRSFTPSPSISPVFNENTPPADPFTAAKTPTNKPY